MKSPTTTITIRTGTEGPRLDPYSFTEITVTRSGKTVMLHDGLSTYLKVDGKEIHRTGGDSDAELEALFTKEAGVSRTQIQRIQRKIYRRCKCCGSRKLGWVDGYPGEELLMCMTCETILTSSFNFAAIV